MIPFICPAPPKKQLSECFTVHPASPPFRLSAVHACYNPVESIIQTAYNTDINLQCNTYSHFNKSHQNKEDTMIQINKELCIGCGKCVKDCPVFCISITDHKASASGDCMNCGHCAALCPKEAISIPGYDMNDVEIYNENSFSLEPDTLLRTIKFRRSIRDYKPLPVEKETLQKVLQAGRYTARTVILFLYKKNLLRSNSRSGILSTTTPPPTAITPQQICFPIFLSISAEKPTAKTIICSAMLL